MVKLRTGYAITSKKCVQCQKNGVQSALTDSLAIVVQASKLVGSTRTPGLLTLGLSQLYIVWKRHASIQTVSLQYSLCLTCQISTAIVTASTAMPVVTTVSTGIVFDSQHSCHKARTYRTSDRRSRQRL